MVLTASQTPRSARWSRQRCLCNSGEHSSCASGASSRELHAARQAAGLSKALKTATVRLTAHTTLRATCELIALKDSIDYQLPRISGFAYRLKRYVRRQAVQQHWQQVRRPKLRTFYGLAVLAWGLPTRAVNSHAPSPGNLLTTRTLPASSLPDGIAWRWLQARYLGAGCSSPRPLGQYLTQHLPAADVACPWAPGCA